MVYSQSRVSESFYFPLQYENKSIFSENISLLWQNVCERIKAADYIKEIFCRLGADAFRRVKHVKM